MPPPQPDNNVDNPLYHGGHVNSPAMQQVLSHRTPAQDALIHQLPQANSENYQNEPGLFVWGYDYEYVYYQQSGVIYNATQAMIDSVVEIFLGNNGD